MTCDSSHVAESHVAAKTLLAVPLTSAEVPLPQQVRAARAAGADLVELRVDSIGDVAAVEALLKQPRAVPLILTVRSAAEGGAWTGSDAERLALLQRLGLLRPGYVDVELATWQRSANVRQKVGLVSDTEPHDATDERRRPKNRLILSHHNLQDTPADLNAVMDRFAHTPADLRKLVFTARDATDAFRVLAWLAGRSDAGRLIVLAMGEAGLPTRVLARKFGTFLTFATLHAGEESAPGQPTVADLRGLYRWDQISPDTRVYGVVGWPVMHSQSPAIHNAAMDAAHVDGVYLPLPVRPDATSFDAFMDCITPEAALSVTGLSVTLPHKENAFRWLDQRGLAVSSIARRCGAVNTLTRRPEGTWEGENTDVIGAVEALQSVPSCAGNRLSGRQVAILGAGGAARAVVAALLDRGCKITLYNRSAERARRLAHSLRCAWKPWEARREYAGEVLINCTSVGLWPAVDESPMPEDALRSETVVFDTIYRPAETRLLRTARGRGCTVVSGVRMFIGQAAAQARVWYGPAAADRMRQTKESASLGDD